MLFVHLGEGLAVNWKWTWLNFINSTLINRFWFLMDKGIYNLHAWVLSGADIITDIDKSQTIYQHMDFYIMTLLSIILLALFQRSTSHFGVLLPETPEVAHALQDGHVGPFLDIPPPTLTRPVSFIFTFIS